MINLKFTVDEVNVILQSLSKMPYELVNELMAKVHQQAKPQVEELQKKTEPDLTNER
jgi:hypothetical protein